MDALAPPGRIGARCLAGDTDDRGETVAADDLPGRQVPLVDERVDPPAPPGPSIFGAGGFGHSALRRQR